LDASGAGDTDAAIACLNLIKQLKDSGVNIVATNNGWGGADASQAAELIGRSRPSANRDSDTRIMAEV
jgi:hypothetical protein